MKVLLIATRRKHEPGKGPTALLTRFITLHAGMEGSPRLVCIAVANQHPVEHSAAVEVNCQRRVIAVSRMEVVQVTIR